MSSTVAEIEELAFQLEESQRAQLAANLLRSLPPMVREDDGGLAEAIRRDREMDKDPERAVSLDELDRLIANRPTR